MNGLTEKLILVAFGWVLGLFSLIIGEWFKKGRERREARLAILTELKELQYRFASIAILLAGRIGRYDRQFLTWVQPILARYAGVHSTQNVLKSVELGLKLTDEQLAANIRAAESAADSRPMLKKFYAPMLDAKLAPLAGSNPGLESLLLELKAKVNILNEEVELFRGYWNLTYGSTLSDENRGAVVRNIDAAYGNVFEQCGLASDLVDRIRKAWNDGV